MRSFVAALAFAALAPSAADAAIYNFSYQASTVLIEGRLQGTLQPDGYTIVISAILGTPTVNGVPAVPLSFVESVQETPGLDNYLPVATLDGLVMDFIACETPTCEDGFLLTTVDIGFGNAVFGAGATFGNVIEPYDPSGWSISLVPEPASWALMIAGFGLVGASVRRRKAALAA